MTNAQRVNESAPLGFTHNFIPGENSSSPVLLLLHGTGGTEHDLLALGQMLLPGAALLSPRGKVLEHGMPRFFRRLAEGVFDLDDLKRRTHELAAFIEEARERYGLESNNVIGTGYSNGANIAASLMLLRPDVLSGAVLFRAMVPFKPERPTQLRGVPVLLSSGARDPIVPRSNTLALEQILKDGGADVTLNWSAGGHELTRGDVEAARDWLTERKMSSGAVTARS